MQNILDKIIENKIKELEGKKRTQSSFKQRLKSPDVGDVAIIAEIKLKSPSAGIIATKNQVSGKAIEYEQAGVDCLSVITDRKYFDGDIKFIKDLKQEISLPILQKDFVIDPYQIYEAKMAGSDAILLIAKIVTAKKLQEFVRLTYEIGIEPVVEVYDEEDLKKALTTKAEIIGVNARNLRDFKVDVRKAAKLLAKLPDTKIKVGFSGVNSGHEVKVYREFGARAVLVGTTAMKVKEVKNFILQLRNC